MAWKDAVTETGIAELGKGAYQALGTKEIAYVYVNRTDAGSTNPMEVRVWTSPDGGTTETDVPMLTFYVDASDDSVAFNVTGVPYYAIGLGSAATDTITMDVIHVLDNGLTV